MSPPKRRHAVSAGRLVRRLSVYLEQNPTGEISIAEGGFRAGPRQTLHCPDVGYTSNERAGQAPLDQFYPFAPDVAVEVWSPDNTEQEMSDKQDIPTMPPLRPRRSLPHRLIGGAGITRSQKQ